MSAKLFQPRNSKVVIILRKREEGSLRARQNLWFLIRGNKANARFAHLISG
jgi:hypothetical protein